MKDSEVDTVVRYLNESLRHSEATSKTTLETTSETINKCFIQLVEASRDSERRRDFCIPSALQVCCKILEYNTTKAESSPDYVEAAIVFLNNSCPDDDSVDDLEANKRAILQGGGLGVFLKLLYTGNSPLWEKALSALNNLCFEYAFSSPSQLSHLLRQGNTEAAQRELAEPASGRFQTIVQLALAQRQSLEVQDDQQDDVCNLIEMTREHLVPATQIADGDYMPLCRAAWQVNWKAENFCIIANTCLKLFPNSQITSTSSRFLDSLFAVAQASFRYFDCKLDSKSHSGSCNDPSNREELIRHDCRNTQNNLLEKLYEVSQGKFDRPKSLLSHYVKIINAGDDQPGLICACYVLCGLVLQGKIELLSELSTNSFAKIITQTVSVEDNIQGLRGQLQLIGLLAVSSARNARLNFELEGTITTFARLFHGRGTQFVDPQTDAAIAARKLMIESVPVVSQFFGLTQWRSFSRADVSYQNAGHEMLELCQATENADLKVEIARVMAQVCRTLRREPQHINLLEDIFTHVEDESLLLRPVMFVATHHPSEGARIESWMAMGVLTEVAGGRGAFIRALSRDTTFRDKIKLTAQLELGYERENLKLVLAHVQDEPFQDIAWFADIIRNLGLKSDRTSKQTVQL